MKMRKFVFAFLWLELLGILVCQTARDVAANDWLLDPTPYRAEVNYDDARKELTLANGLLERRILLAPNAATVSLRNLTTGEELVRATSPEARVTIDGIEYPVGG